MVPRETHTLAALTEMGFGQLPRRRLQEAARLLDLLVELLLTSAIPKGLIGPREGPRLLERHVLESAALYPFVSGRDRVIDVGSGAGLPGLVLAVLLDRGLVMLEAEGRRANFLREARGVLDIGVTVVQGRAEELARAPDQRETYDAAVSRALAPPPVALELMLPFVRLGGHAVIAAGRSVDRDAAGVAARLLGGAEPQMKKLQVPGLEQERWAMIVEKREATSERYPRRTGVPARRPLAVERQRSEP